MLVVVLGGAMTELLTLAEAVRATGRSASTLRRLIRAGRLDTHPRRSDRDPLLFTPDALASAGLVVTVQVTADTGRADALAVQVATLTAERDAARSETQQVRAELTEKVTQLTADLASERRAFIVQQADYRELTQALAGALAQQRAELPAQGITVQDSPQKQKRVRWFSK